MVRPYSTVVIICFSVYQHLHSINSIK